MKDKLLNIRVNEGLMEQLNRVSAVLDIPYSQFVRQAILEKINETQKEFPQLALEAGVPEQPLKQAA